MKIKELKKDRFGKINTILSRITAFTLIFALVFSGADLYAAQENTIILEDENEAAESEEVSVSENEISSEGDSYGLSNPRRDASGIVTWDCVYFGSYPQAEVVEDKSTYTALDVNLLDAGDLIEDAELYKELKSASFDTKGLATVTYSGDTYTYKRIKKSDTINIGSSYFYKWSDTVTYHYFRCEPIKWRVLSVDGSDALLMADKCIDAQYFHPEYHRDCRWDKSTIRSWLNGYDCFSNKTSVGYTDDGFIVTAFTSDEKNAIKQVSVANPKNSQYGVINESDTKDKVFLLSEAEVCNASYGFLSDGGESDRARESSGSTYSKAMGASISSQSCSSSTVTYWLRTPGYDQKSAVTVSPEGRTFLYGDELPIAYPVRPALHLNLSSNVHSLAGTVDTEEKTSGNSNVELTVFANRKNSSTEKDDYINLESGKITTDKGAVVTTGDSGAKKGKATLDTADIKSSVDITAKGYINRTISKKRLICGNDKGALQAKSVYMEPENDGAPTVLALWVDDIDVRHEAYNLLNYDKTEITLEAEVDWGKSSADRIFLYQNGKEADFTDNTLTTVISNNFDTASKIYICAKDSDGQVTRKPLCFRNMADDTVSGRLDGLDVSFSDKASVTLPDSVPILGGSKVSMGLQSAVPVTFVVEDGKFYGAVGFDLLSGSDKLGDDEKLEVKNYIGNFKDMWNQTDAKKKIEKFKKFKKDKKKYIKENKGSLGYDFDITAVGFVEGTLDDEGMLHILDGGLMFNPSGSVKGNYLFAIPPIPIPMYVEGNLSADFENQLNLAISKTGKGFTPSGEVSGTVKLEIGPCIGVKDIVYGGGGVYGSLSPDWIIRLNSPDYFKLTASYGGYLKAGFLLWEGKKSIKVADSVWIEKPKPGSAKASAGGNAIQAFDNDDFNSEGFEYKLKDLSYLDSSKNVLQDMMPLDIDDDNILDSNVYRESEVSYVKSSSGDSVAFWITSDNSDANNLQLNYSINRSGEWSEPKKVLDDGTIDYMPVAIEYNGTAAVAWMNATDKFELNDALTMEDVASHMEIRLAVLDGDSFESYKLDSEGCDMLPRIATDGYELCVAWVNNAGSSIMGEGDNSIQYAIFDGEEVSEITTAYEALGAVDGMAVSYDGGVNIAYTQDSDGDDATIDDIRLYENGTAVADSDYTQVRPRYYDDELYWYSNGNILSRSINAEETGMIPLSPYKLVTTGGHLQVLYLNGNGISNKIYASTYNESQGRWSTPVVYADHDNYIFSFDVTDDSELEFITNDVTVTGDVPSEDCYGRADICVSRAELQESPKITYISYDPDSFEAGSSISLGYSVANGGNSAMEGYTITVTDDEGRVIATKSVGDAVLPGEELDGEIEVAIPEDCAAADLKVSCESNGTDKAASEPYEIRVDNENVYIDNCSIIFEEDGSAEVRCGIGNSGTLTRDDLVVTLYKNNVRGEKVQTQENITAVPGEFTDLLFNIPSADESVYYLSIDNAEDAYSGDDSDYLFSAEYETESREVIYFEANGGSVDPFSKEILTGSKYGSLPVPEREGYEFLGWYTEVEGGTKINAEDVVTDITLYAHWQKVQTDDPEDPEDPDDPENPEKPEKSEIEWLSFLEETSEGYTLNLAVGQKQLIPELKKSRGESGYRITEDRANKRIAVMSSKGVITAKREGTAVISVQKGGNTITVTVNVQIPRFSAKTYTMNLGEAPENPIVLDYNNCSLKPVFTIPTKQQQTATVSMNSVGKPVVTAIKRGTVTVTATVGEGKYARKTRAKVRIYDPQLKLYKDRTSVKVGKTLKASVKYGAKGTVWTSSDESIATVRSGKIKGIAPGHVIITAVNNGRKMTQEITVE